MAEKLLHSYETIFIIDASLDEEATKAVIDKFLETKEDVNANKVAAEELMEVLGLDEENFVVDIPNKEEMNILFESSFRRFNSGATYFFIIYFPPLL